MSHSRRRLKEDTLSAFPIPTAEETITRVVGLRGACVCEVEQANGERLLCQIPTKFRKTVWIKKGSKEYQKFTERKLHHHSRSSWYEVFSTKNKSNGESCPFSRSNQTFKGKQSLVRSSHNIYFKGPKNLLLRKREKNCQKRILGVARIPIFFETLITNGSKRVTVKTAREKRRILMEKNLREKSRSSNFLISFLFETM